MGDLDVGEEELLKRFRELEANQEELRGQLGLVLRREGMGIGSRAVERDRREECDHDKRNGDGDGENRGSSGKGRSRGQDGDRQRQRECHDVVILPGYFGGNPYRSVLQHLGHAVYVCRPVSGEIIYWNVSAENLYGWRDYEALGKNYASLLIDDENQPFFGKVMDLLHSGQRWSGQIPFRKRSGEVFVAMVTKSPLYENNELIGIITVASDSAILDEMNKEQPSDLCNDVRGQHREFKLRFGGLRPQPDIASSVSNLASKLLPHIHSYSNGWGENYRDRCGCDVRTDNGHARKPGTTASKTIFRLHSGLKAIEEMTNKYEEIISKFNQRSKIAAKVFSKLHIRGNVPNQDSDEGSQSNSGKNPEADLLPPISPDNYMDSNRNENSMPKLFSLGSKEVPAYVDKKLSQNAHSEECCGSHCSNEPEETVGGGWKKDVIGCVQSVERGLKRSEKDGTHGLRQFEDTLSAPATLQQHQRLQKHTENSSSVSANSANSAGTHASSQTGSPPAERKNLEIAMDCEIHWEDISLGEEVGQGSFAVVYRGVWNGSDVAIKVYIGNEYKEGLLLDYKKEIAIMKRLRHPNVLLFMGAVYSPERLAIVTEYLPRGSLFRTLHKNNQKLDLKRRLRMALDVARGMNYLHRRSPPIIHRDLKSSNLLVDRNWTVKVGDFGLSCLKISTVATASGRGTPQWMAPEVLRGECTTEKSDVFSFGVILWELMTEAVPWSQLCPLQVIGVVGFMDRRLELPVNIDSRVSGIICNCWDSDPSRRPSFQELVGRVGELIGTVIPTQAPKRSEQWGRE